MLAKTKCPDCGQKYELIWHESEKHVEQWDGHDDDPEDYDETDEEDRDISDDPIYCPFCGTHCDYF